MRVRVVIGTVKGGFVFQSDAKREHWTVEGPIFKGWKVTASHRLPDGRFLIATASDVYGAALHLSDDAVSWKQIEHGPGFPEDSGRKLKQVWTLASGAGAHWAGVDEAALFRSEDGAASWQPVEGLNDHPTRESWYPGAGGLCAHTILFDPRDANRIWCGISAVGVFRSDDGGLSWTPKNRGVRTVIEDRVHKDIGCCVHALTHAPDDANRIYRQDHTGMYRSTDGGDSWERNDEGLGHWFGFPIVIDKTSRNLFAVPLESDEYRLPKEGRLRVYRSTDDGDTWAPLSAGLPEKNAWCGVLRGALSSDHAGGVYLGTTSGTVYFSNDDGESWRRQPVTLPRILSVDAFVLE